MGLITNDQAPELVDSAILSLSGLRVTEVSGSCFCCNFEGFTKAIERLEGADVILAEPVGSCADLSATILQPLKKFLAARLDIAPFTVLADPQRLSSILEGGNGGLHPDAAYIFRKQLEESDIILLTKVDRLDLNDRERLLGRLASKYPGTTVLPVSAQSEEGIGEWLTTLRRKRDCGMRILQIDYDRYAHGEAVLGWLNATVRISDKQTDWKDLLRSIVLELSESFNKENLPVGHLKAIIENGTLFSVANLTGTPTGAGPTDKGKSISLRGEAGISEEAVLILNARVETTPRHLEELAESALAKVLGDTYRQEVLAWKSLQPGRPNPTYRFPEIFRPC